MKNMKIALAIVSLFALAGASQAATLYWDGGTQDNNNQSNNTTTTGQNWLSGGYWDNGASQQIGTWTAGDSAIFGGTAASQTITAGTLTIGNMTFGQGTDGSGTSGTAYTISGGTITLQSTTITANTATIIGSTLAGTSTLTKAGGATLTLSGGNTFTGNATINEGTVVVSYATGGAASSLGNMTNASRTVTVNSGATLQITAADVFGAYNVKPATPIILDGGTLWRVGKESSSSYFNSLGDITLKNGATIKTGTGNVATVQALAFNGTVTVSGTSGSTIVATAGTSLNGIHLGTVGGSTTFDIGSTGSGTDLSISVPLADKVLGGAAGLIKTGAGKMLLSSANTYTGTTTINNGILALGNAAALGTAAAGTSVTSGAVLDLNGQTVTNTEALTLNGTGISSGGALINSSGTAASYAGAITLGSASSIGGSGNATLSGAISGSSYSLTKTGSGTLTLTANSNYDGAVTVNSGTLRLNDARSMNGAITVNSGATLTIENNASGGYYQPDSLTVDGGTVNTVLTSANRYHGIYTTAINLTGTSTISTPLFISKTGTTNNETLTITVSSGSSTISGTILNHPDLSGGLLVKNGGGTLTLTGITQASGNSTTLTGNVTINGGTLNVGGTVNSTSPTVTAIGDMTTNGRTITVNSGATLCFTGSDAIGAYNYTTPVKLIADGGTITRVANTTTFNSIGDVELKNGGRLRTTNGNAATVGSFGLNGNVTVTGTSGSFIDTLAGQNTRSFINLGTTAGSTTFDVASTGDATADLTVSAVLADKTLGGAAALIKTGAGKMVLSAANTYTGATSVNQGTLKIDTTGSLSSTSVSVANTATLNNNGMIAGTVTVAAGGTLSGSGTVQGLTTIGGTHKPGNSPGLDTYAGGLTYDAGSTLEWEFSGDALATRGTDYDGINVTGGTVTLTNAATFKIINYVGTAVDYTAAAWDVNRTFNVISLTGGATLTGTLFTLDDITNAPLDQGSWSLVANAGGLDVKWTAIPEPATFSLLGAAAFAAIWRRRKIG